MAYVVERAITLYDGDCEKLTTEFTTERAHVDTIIFIDYTHLQNFGYNSLQPYVQ